jgi:hypothetical protein
MTLFGSVVGGVRQSTGRSGEDDDRGMSEEGSKCPSTAKRKGVERNL